MSGRRVAATLSAIGWPKRRKSMCLRRSLFTAALRLNYTQVNSSTPGERVTGIKRSAMSNENINSSLEEAVGRLLTMVQSIDSRLLNLEARVESRLFDTRPNFEAIQLQLAEV